METKRSSEEVEIQQSKKQKLDDTSVSKVEVIETLNTKFDIDSVPSENSVGISCYLGKAENVFHGILKQRYSDFLVNEIDLDGNVVHLADITSLPIEDIMKVEEVQEEKEEVARTPLEELQLLVGEENAQKILQFVENEQEHRNTSLSLPEDNDKDHRTQVHRCISSHFGDKISSETKENCVVISFKSESSRKSGWRQNKHPQPRKSASKKNTNQSWNRGDYLEFVLYKEFKDTVEALNILAKLLHAKPKIFTFAGTKDKRAITVQRMTAYRLEAEKLRNLNSKLLGLKVGNFRYVKDRLKLGDLKGNHFTIVLREISASQDVIAAAVSNLQENGFINYYGLQRFGTGAVPTYRVGISLLKGDYKNAVDLILNPRDGENEQCTEARKYWKETGDIEGTKAKLPRWMHIEQTILKGLAQCGSTAYLNALCLLPRNARTLYVHSYQSYVWNHMTSQRIQLYGTSVVVGDLVLVSEEISKSEEEEEDVDELTNNAENFGYTSKVKVITAEDVQQYSITDVVLPLPGHAVVYPTNKIGELYRYLDQVRHVVIESREIMAKDGLSPDSMRHKFKDFSLPGGYRKILIRPSHIQWELLKYNDFQIPLVQSDYDILVNNREPKPVPDGNLTALKISFSLPASGYATMCLRELQHLPTVNYLSTKV